jgi:hypothetical protein
MLNPRSCSCSTTTVSSCSSIINRRRYGIAAIAAETAAGGQEEALQLVRVSDDERDEMMVGGPHRAAVAIKATEILRHC